ncbi:MAG: hypothetical protein WKF97_16290 [Chitinophagaceae bacterium]
MKQTMIFTFLLCLIPIASVLAQYQVYGAIGDKYNTMRASNGNLGDPISNEQSTGDGVGRFQRFKGYDIYWHPSAGAHYVHGPIGDKFYALGAEKGLGYPVTDVTWCKDKSGKYVDFKRFRNPSNPESASIYWSPKLGAFEVYGAIWAKYKSIKASSSPLGYPKSAEYQEGQNRRQQFEHGFIKWNARTGAVVHGPTQFDEGPVLIPAENE